MRSTLNRTSKFCLWTLALALTASIQGCVHKYQPPPPIVLYTNPPLGIKAPRNTLIGAVFDRNIYSIRVEVVDSKGENIYGKLTVKGYYFFLKPYSPLRPNEKYTVMISDVRTIESPPLERYTFTFETSDEIDRTPPRIVKISQLVDVDGFTKPMPLDMPVYPDGAFSITFSEPMFRRFTLRPGVSIEPEVVESMFIAFDSTATEACLDVMGLLEDTNYMIKFKEGLFWDLAGNPMPEYSFSFRTGKRKEVKRDVPPK